MKSFSSPHSPASPGIPGVLASLVVLLSALAAACGSASTNVVAPTAQKCQISVTDFTRTFGATGGSGTATITAARECSWSASSQSAWISLGTSQGTGNGTIAFRVSANQTPQARSGGFAVNSQQLTISQEAAPCRFAVTPASQQVDATGGTGTIAVSAMSGCAWSAASQSPWLSLSGAGGNGNGSVSFTAAANAGAERSGGLVVAGQTVTVIQTAAPPVPTPPTPPPPPTPPSCQFAVTPTSLSFSSAGGQSSIGVATGSGCTWQATSSAAWLTLAPDTGTKSATITVTAAPNADTVARSATITVAGQTVQVSQDGAAAPTPVQLSGDLSHLRGDCPSLAFTVQGVSVVTNADTVFVGKACDKIKNGQQVTVDGLQQPGQPVVAARVTAN